jgi:hypothetical protein
MVLYSGPQVKGIPGNCPGFLDRLSPVPLTPADDAGEHRLFASHRSVAVNIDWLAVWQRVKPILIQILVAALSGGAVGYQCGHQAGESAAKVAIAAQK